MKGLVTQRLAARALPAAYQTDPLPIIKTAVQYGWLDQLITAALAYRIDAKLLSIAEDRCLAVRPPLGVSKLERIVRQSTQFQDVAQWRTILAQHEAAVCRVETNVDGQWKSVGTAFLVGPDIVLTCHHVVANLVLESDVTEKLRFRFDFKRSTDGIKLIDGHVVKPSRDWLILHAPAASAEIDPHFFQCEPADGELDFALIELERPIGNEPVGTPNTNIPGRSRGWIHLRDDTALAPFAPKDITFILQHPDGDALQMAAGSVIEILPCRVRYDANTLPGSSGSPCFNASLDLVAMHHNGGTMVAKSASYNQGVPTHLIAAFCAKRDITFKAPES